MLTRDERNHRKTLIRDSHRKLLQFVIVDIDPEPRGYEDSGNQYEVELPQPRLDYGLDDFGVEDD